MLRRQIIKCLEEIIDNQKLYLMHQKEEIKLLRQISESKITAEEKKESKEQKEEKVFPVSIIASELNVYPASIYNIIRTRKKYLKKQKYIEYREVNNRTQMFITEKGKKFLVKRLGGKDE